MTDLPLTFKIILALQTVAMAAMGGFVTVMVWSFKTGRWVASINYGPELEALTKDFALEKVEIRRRLDVAGEEQSKLATKVQALPETLRRDFIPRSELELRFGEASKDRERLWAEVKQLWRTADRRRP